MAYPPPRPPMPMPGMPPLPQMLPPPYAMSVVTGALGPMAMGMIPAPMMTPVAMVPVQVPAALRPVMKSAPPTTYKKMESLAPLDIQPPQPKGPTITVFVGNIPDQLRDSLLRKILVKCGTVINWKRVQGANGKLQAFGFCEYADAEGALKAIRLLHDFECCGKKLVVKVDSKAKSKLDEYKANKELDGEEEQMANDDKEAKTYILELLKTEVDDIGDISFDDSSSSRRQRSPERRRRRSPHSEGYRSSVHGSADNGFDGDSETRTELDDMGLEEDKKNLIHREIDKFRDTYKRAEEELLKPRNGSSGGKKSSRSRREPEERSPPERSASREREVSKDREREREREREKERERERERERDREWEAKDKEDEDDIYERKKLERKLREKQHAYNERLKNWEIREKKRAKEYEKEREKEELRKRDEAKEAKRLKEFLEDYDDERDDPKYYKGRALSHRLKDREKEIEADYRDKQKEKEELEELRRKLAEEGHPDPQSEVERLHREEEARFLPPTQQVVAELAPKPSEAESLPPPPLPQEDESTQNSISDLVTTPQEESKSLGFQGIKLNNSPGTLQSGRKRSVEEAFASDENDQKPKKRPPVVAAEDENSSASKSSISEEKREHIRLLIEKIPTSKEELFAYEVDWSCVDENLIERRVRPWVNKKIVEYIGEEEATLVDFICSKVLTGSSAQNILEDVLMVLDEDAEVFVVKMWRLLIYEILAKKAGLVKPQ